MGVMPLPVVKKGGKAAVRAYLDCGMGIVATSEKQEAAAKFLEILFCRRRSSAVGKTVCRCSKCSRF